MQRSHDIIVLGASLGGIQALSKIVRSLPPNFGATLIAVIHTAADGPRLLPAVIGSHTVLPVAFGNEGDKPRPGHIYIAQPGVHSIVRPDGRLGLDPGPKVNHSRPAADKLFQSAAAVYGPRVLGVVLTGGDGDGTKGLTAIKAAGGISIVQQPDDAANPEMPVNALEQDHPDYVVPLNEMGSFLVALVESALRR